MQPVVRIPKRMHIPLAAIDVAAGNVQQRDRARDIEIPRASALDLPVSRAIEQQRHPSRLEIEADECPHISAPELEDEARLRLDKMRILVTFADVRRGYAAAAHRFPDIVQVGRTRHDAELCTGWRGDQCGARERGKYR